MINSELINYVKQSLRQNIGEQDIRGTLLAAGWAQTDINDAVSTVRSLQAVNASAGIVSNYSDNGNGKATLQNGGQTMQEPIIGVVKGLESGTAQFWSSAPKHYAAIFTPERVIFINIKNSAASSVVSGLIGGAIGSAINLVDEELKIEDMTKELNVKGINNVLGEHPEAVIVLKENLQNIEYKIGSFWNGSKGKIGVTANGLTRIFYAPQKGFERFQSMAANITNGTVYANISAKSSVALNAPDIMENEWGWGIKKSKIITKIIGIIYIILGAFHILGGLGFFLNGEIAGAIVGSLMGLLFITFAVLTLKMKRWAIYIIVAGCFWEYISIRGTDTSSGVPLVGLVITYAFLALGVGSAAYLWSIRRVLK